MQGEPYAELTRSILANGLQLPISVNAAGVILDGRAELRFRVMSLSADEEVDLILAANVQRRHLSTSQRAMVAARWGDLGNITKIPTLADRAEAMNASVTTLLFAQTVLKHGSAALIRRVDNDEVTVSNAASKVDVPTPKAKPRRTTRPKPSGAPGQPASEEPVAADPPEVGAAGAGVVAGPYTPPQVRVDTAEPPAKNSENAAARRDREEAPLADQTQGEVILQPRPRPFDLDLDIQRYRDTPTEKRRAFLRRQFAFEVPEERITPGQIRDLLDSAIEQEEQRQQRRAGGGSRRRSAVSLRVLHRNPRRHRHERTVGHP